MLETTCLFCRIAAREEPAEVLHATEAVMAFRDANPRAPTHILLIPREHIDSAADLTEHHAGMLADLMQSAAHLAKTEGLDGGYRLVTNIGPDGGQHVHHLHFHLLGGRRMAWPPG
jgi:histidine triad (HIT) family protein